MRCGLLVYISSDRAFENISISNVEVKDVFYEAKGFSRGESEVTTPNGTQSYGWGIRVLNNSAGGKLKNISIKGCKVENVSHSGIRFKTTNFSKFDGIEIKNNVVNTTGGPGIVLHRSTTAQVSGNNISYSGSFDDSRKWGRGSGLWTWGSSKVLIEKNTFSHANGPADSAGCHIDFNCNDIIVQHNLSHSNAGGFIEILGNNQTAPTDTMSASTMAIGLKGKEITFRKAKPFG